MREREAYFEYLDELEDSGIIDMSESAELMADDFGISIQTAERILIAWMQSRR